MPLVARSQSREARNRRSGSLHGVSAEDMSGLDEFTLGLLAAGRFHAAMPSAKQYWLVKQEPSTYSWDDFVKDKGCEWDGVRNYQARNNLRAMKKGDLLLFYHSVSEKQVVGIAKVASEHYPDPTAKEGDWSCVDLKPVKAMKEPVTLDTIKAQKKLNDMVLLKNSRLSVQPITKVEFDTILKLGATKP